MPFSDPEKQKEYHNEYRKKKRRERGLQKQGRKPLTLVEKEHSLDKRKEWEKEWKKLYSEYRPQKRLIWAAKRRAKQKNLEFNITEEDIVIPEECPYLKIKLKVTSPRGSNRGDVMSLDRINPSLGYTKGNVEVISYLANTMKSNATTEQLRTFAKAICSRLGCGDYDHQQGSPI